MQKFGVGVVGLGYSGTQHLNAYLKNKKVVVKGIYDINKNIIKSFSNLHNNGLKFISFEEMLKQKDIDIISICTPDHLHADQAIQALKAGKNVLCEKPMATTFEDCKKIIKAVRDTGKKFLTGQILRFSPYFIALKKLYDEGELGEAFFTESDYLHDLRSLASEWRTGKNKKWNPILGGGCHPIDLLRWVVGDIVEIYAVANKAVANANYLYDNIVLSLKFKNGCIGKAMISIGCTRPYALNFSIYGTKGTLINNKIFLEKILKMQDFMTIPLKTVEEFPYYNDEIEHLIDCLENNKKPLVDEIEGAKTVAVCLAGISSVKKNEPIKIDYNF